MAQLVAEEIAWFGLGWNSPSHTIIPQFKSLIKSCLVGTFFVCLSVCLSVDMSSIQQLLPVGGLPWVVYLPDRNSKTSLQPVSTTCGTG